MPDPTTSNDFHINPGLELLRTCESLTKESPNGLIFFEELCKQYGSNAVLLFLKKIRPLLDWNIQFEPKHLSSEENVIFSILEEKFYPNFFNKLYKFLDFQAWGLIGAGFIIESKFNLSGLSSPGSNETTTAHFVSIGSLFLCGACILYEVYEKAIEYKLLNEIKSVARELIEITPKELLDQIRAEFTINGKFAPVTQKTNITPTITH